MKKLLASVLFLMAATSCTYSVTMMHTEGSNDTLDENQTTDPTVTPTVNVPISVMPARIPLPEFKKELIK
jgi:hypothetical protein